MNFQTILTDAPAILQLVTAFVTIFSIIANFTPTDSDNKIVAALQTIVHVVALNFFHLNDDGTALETTVKVKSTDPATAVHVETAQTDLTKGDVKQ